MGLDMYLKASKYVGGWNHNEESEKQIFSKIMKLVGGVRCEDAPSLTVNMNVAYWRKANAIHQWFVENVQDGEDDCKEYHVSRENLEELKSICEQVLADPQKASELLPTTDGFFFGSTKYDEWYTRDLQHTVKSIDEVLQNYDDEWTFEYQSSW